MISWLSENDFVPRAPERKLVRYIKWLKSHDWHTESGAYSTVFMKKGSRTAIKISDHPGWLSYALWARATPFRRQFAPKIYSLKWYGRYFVVHMERVPKLGDRTPWQTRQLVMYARSLAMHYAYMENKKERTKEVDKRFPGLRRFLLKLFREFDEDLHGQNWGVRKDGSICIFDPTCGRLDYKHKRLRKVRPTIRRRRYV